jgi:hypothetical protein
VLFIYACIDRVSKHNNVDQKIALLCDLFERKLKCKFLLANRLVQIDLIFYIMECLLVSVNRGLFKEGLNNISYCARLNGWFGTNNELEST